VFFIFLSEYISTIMKQLTTVRGDFFAMSWYLFLFLDFFGGCNQTWLCNFRVIIWLTLLSLGFFALVKAGNNKSLAFFSFVSSVFFLGLCTCANLQSLWACVGGSVCECVREWECAGDVCEWVQSDLYKSN